jgi:alkylhydroperoxidase family enzyme
MAWIRRVSDEDAKGLVASIYEAARRRAGRVFEIVRLQSLHPEALHAGLDLYLSVVRGRSPLRRWEREAIAVLVSQANACHY